MPPSPCADFNRNMRKRVISNVARLPELDILRGAAIVLMVLFHIVFDLRNFFGFTGFVYHRGFWYYEGRLSAILFIMAAGMVSAVITNQVDPKAAWQKNLRRGVRLIGLGMIITAVTWLFYRDWTIWFGILHFLGIGIILSTLFSRFRWLNLVLGVLAIGMGSLFLKLKVNHPWFLIFGIQPHGFQSFDYFSLFPWFGVVLIGLGLGNFVYQKKATLSASKRLPHPAFRPLIWLGKYSLWIYLIHQPILLAIFWVIL